MKKQYKELIWHALIVIFFVLFSFAYFSPMLENKVIRQMDFEHSKAVGKETATYFNSEHRDIAWTNSLFGGMPTYQVGGQKLYGVYSIILNFFKHIMPYGTVSSLFIYLIGFYILLLTFKVDKWISAAGAVAFGLSSYNIIIIAAGHITKTYAIGFMPIVFAGYLLIYDRKYWLGFILALLGLGMQVATTHVQIVYYTLISLAVYVIFKLIWDLKEKKLKQFVIATLISAASVLLVVLPNIGSLWRAYELGKYTIRGKSELTVKNTDSDKVSTGLDKDYALSWSYGIGESWSLLIPNIKGGATNSLETNPDALKKADNQYVDYIKQQNHYWGDQPFTSGPVYLGAIIIFLFVLGMFVVKDKIKWWILAITVLSILLSWGKNFEGLTNFFFYYVPFYNKFRSVSMTLVIASVAVPFLGFLALNEFYKDKELLKKSLKYVWISLGLTAGIALLFWLIPGFFKFTSVEETKYFDDLLKQIPVGQKQQFNNFIEQLEIVRKSIFKADAIRTFIFIIFAFATLLLYGFSKNFSKGLLVGLLAFFILIDMWVIDRRYLGSKDFVSKSKSDVAFQKSPADDIILKDVDKYYRVVNIATNPFSDAYTSYYHKSIGGYHGAKLRRYQEIIDYYLANEIGALQQAFGDTTKSPTDLLPMMQITNMLNTKYIIYNPNYFPLVNTYAFGNAWFVDSYKFVETPDDEIKSLAEVNLLRTAVINKNKFNTQNLPAIEISNDTTRTIVLKDYKPDRLVYDVNSQKGGFVVFSEIYYPGWKATMEGKEIDIYQTNYILRGIYVPAGLHTITFEFKPAAIYVAKNIEIISSIIVLLSIAAAIYFMWKGCKTSAQSTEKSETNKQK